MGAFVTTEMSLPSGPAGPERETRRRVWHDGTVNLLDLVIILLVVLAIINGYRRGAALQITAYLGLLLGLLIGALIAPPVAGLARSPFGEAALALITLIAMAAIGDAIGWFVGAKVWAVTHRTVLGTVDSVAGSFVAIVAVLLTVWFIGSNLSQGPYQTLSNQIQGSAIIRSLDDALPRPPALLLDEPLTGLDPVGIRRMKSTIVRRAEEGAAVILSSHLLHLVEEICTRVLIMHRGKAVAFGTIPEIIAARRERAGRRLEDVFLALIGQDGEAET